MGAFVVASTSMFVSCKDYDDDINNLQEQIDKNADAIKNIKDLIQSGAVITSVDKITDGVKVTLSNGNSFNVTNGVNGTNGTNGKDGVVWTIGDDGFWYQDGVKTNYYALGKDGKDADPADKWTIGNDGYWYLNGSKTEYKAVGTDGKNADPADKWTIGNDGYWYLNGSKTEYKAIGSDGSNGNNGNNGQGTPGQNGQNGKYYVPNTETGCFDIYQDGEFVESTNISFVSAGTITAVKDGDTLTLYGVRGGTGPQNTVTISLSADLKSMQFIPKLYLDGIEAIEYPWVGDSILQLRQYNRYEDLSHHAAVNGDRHDITGKINDYIPNRLGRWYNEATKQIETNVTDPANKKYHFDYSTVSNLSDKEWIYGPAWEVQYHLNPSTSAVDYANNAPSFNVLEPEVVYFNTRAAANSLGITSPEDFFVNNKAFTYPAVKFGKNAKGELSVGLQIAHPENLAPWPTDNTINPNGCDPTNADWTKNTDTPNDWDVFADEDYFGSWYCGNHSKYIGRYHYNKDNKDNVIALQLHNVSGSEDMVTSDYALLVPTRIQLEGLIWNKKPQYIEPKDEYFKGGPGNRNGDEEGWAALGTTPCVNNRIHVWDSPEEALADPDGAALELGAMDPNGVDLRPYLAIHYVKENLIEREHDANHWVVKKFNYGEEAAFGLHYEFQLVDYQSSTNVTGDSHYASFSDWSATNGIVDWTAGKISKTGVIIARNVDPTPNAVKTLEAQSTTSVDREPLVRVMVKNEAGKVLLDGYILLHITHTPDNLNVDNYPEVNLTFGGCNELKLQTYWNQFSNLILHEKLNMSEILTFDNYYWADCIESDTPVDPTDTMYVTPYAFQTNAATPDSHRRGYQLRLYNFGSDIYGNGGLPPVKGSAVDENGNAFEEAATGKDRTTLGNAVYFPNGEGTTNHTFSWTLTPDEIEYLTHDKANDEPVKVTRWFRFIAKDKSGRDRNVDNYSAPYPYIWVKMTMNITRAKVNPILFKEKIDNYWYNYSTGATDGWSAYIADIQAPRDGITTRFEAWPSFINYTLVGNKATIGNNDKIKYYFAPKTYQIKAMNGKTYTITPQNKTYRQNDAKWLIEPNTDRWNKMMCKYVYGRRSYDNVYGDGTQFSPAQRWIKTMNDTHTWDEATLEQTLQRCAIIYDDEVTPNGTTIRYAGVFNDSILYAEINGISTPIAFLRPTNKVAATQRGKSEQVGNNYTPAVDDAGCMELIHWLPVGSTEADYIAGTAKDNVVLYDVLNAIGYPMNADGTCDFDNARKYVNEQFRAWIGVIAQRDCNLAKFVKQDKYEDPNIATVLHSWERPINLNTEPITPAIDANTNENKILLLDYLHLFDWRGDYNRQGYMYDDPDKLRGENHWWFWAYYNVKGIALDMRPEAILTNMHQANENTFVKLSTITTKAKLYAIEPYMTSVKAYFGECWDDAGNRMPGIPQNMTYAGHTYNGWGLCHKDNDGNDANNFQSAFMEVPIEAYMKFYKHIFGGFYYANNGEMVTVFDVKIPITIYYEWGSFDASITWHIDSTHGRH